LWSQAETYVQRSAETVPGIHETAYPRLKASVTARDLMEVYTPTPEECAFAASLTRRETARACFAPLLKTFQRLGYFVYLQDVPAVIVTHITAHLGVVLSPHELHAYERSGARRRHVAAIRDYLHVKPYKQEAQEVLDRSIRRLPKRPTPSALKTVEQLIAERIEPVNILDVLTDIDNWLQWTRFFGLLSGRDARMKEAWARYVATTFCYGCNLGPTQTAQSLGIFDRRQLTWIDLRHITEDKLDAAITALINIYNQFALPKFWGSGKSASADGMKWDIYEQNLLAEYHIRYGSYGGIGYYHVSDTYVALFSHFIPCGVWGAVYILDGLLKNTSDIQPDTLHADTQGQNTPVFGLAHLLGIRLMPRIRNWKDLKLFRPAPEARY